MVIALAAAILYSIDLLFLVSLIILIRWLINSIS